MPGILDLIQQAEAAQQAAPATAAPDPLEDPLRDPLQDAQLSFGDKLGRAFHTSGWQKKSLDLARERLATLSLRQAMGDHYDLFFRFACKESSQENLLFLKALDAGMAEGGLLKRFIREGAPDEINIAGELRQRILAGDLPPSAARAPIETQITRNTLSRFRNDKASIAALARTI